MEEFANFYCGFIDTNLAAQGAAAIPILFIYDRTAALEEGDDQKDALLYPVLQQEETENDKATVTLQINLIGQLIGLASKLEQELGCSLPTVCRLENTNFYFLHIEKYTVSLRRPSTYPERVAQQELDMVYHLFKIFFGGFSTAHIPTTASKLTNNPDKDKAADIAQLLLFLSKINRPQIAECVGSWSFKTPSALSTTTTNQPSCVRELVRSLSLLVESLCSTYAVVGALSQLNGNLLLTKNLTSKFVQLLTLVLAGELAEFGNQVESVVQNVSVIICYLNEEHLNSVDSLQSDECFYALIHIHGDLSLTLLVQTKTKPISADTFQDTWRRPCTRLKDELLHLYLDHRANVENANLPIQESSTELTQTVRLHKPSNTMYALSSATFDPRTLEQRRNANAALNPSNQLWQDWYMKSVAICQQAFVDMPSVTEIRLGSATDYALHSSQGIINNSFTGAVDAKALSSIHTTNI